MSRIGKQQITIPNGISINIDKDLVVVKGSKGELSKSLDTKIVDIKIVENLLSANVKKTDNASKSLWGASISHIKNMIKGVSEGFEKKLIIEGVGFKWEVLGDKLKLSIGFSHPVFVDIPKDLKVVAEKGSLSITGIDKEKVTLFAMQVRKLKRGEPYKGKGIRYSDEVLRRKEGKKSA